MRYEATHRIPLTRHESDSPARFICLFDAHALVEQISTHPSLIDSLCPEFRAFPLFWMVITNVVPNSRTQFQSCHPRAQDKSRIQRSKSGTQSSHLPVIAGGLE